MDACALLDCISRLWHCGRVDLSFFGVWPSSLPPIIQSSCCCRRPTGNITGHHPKVMLTLERTQEEAGLGKDHLRMVDGFLQRLYYQVRGKDKEVIYWLAELRDPNTQVILSDEHQDYRWAKLEEACKLAKYQDLQDTLTAAQHYLETQGKQ
uniref:Nudix (nucleoside diphosphate linked moiety X)-type motif 2 n=1 Tax=Cyprinus carpio TaxID=7962 RepID=A0A8C2K1S5_CYPCA